MPAQWVDLGDRLDRVAEELEANRLSLFIRREDLDHIAPHAKRAAMKIKVVALVLDVYQLAQQGIALNLGVFFDKQDQLKVGFRRTQTIDARDAGDDEGVAPLQERLGGRVAHLVDLFVDRRVLLDIRVAPRNVGFRLVVVVVADEVTDGVVGKQLFELVVELSREGFVGGHDQRRPVHLGDDVRHGKSLA